MSKYDIRETDGSKPLIPAAAVERIARIDENRLRRAAERFFRAANIKVLLNRLRGRGGHYE